MPSYSALDRVSQDDLLTTALLLYPHTEHPDMTITFPSMSFICSGVIQKVFLVAKEANGPEAPVFQLQTEGMNLLISHPLINLVEVVRNNMTGIALYECETNISYSLNYNFSFYQPPLSASQVVLQYQQGGGPMGNVLNNIQTSLQDNPLVAVQASESPLGTKHCLAVTELGCGKVLIYRPLMISCSYHSSFNVYTYTTQVILSVW